MRPMFDINAPHHWLMLLQNRWESERATEIEEWCDANFKYPFMLWNGAGYSDNDPPSEPWLEVAIEHDSDAVFFRLRWADEIDVLEPKVQLARI